MLGSASVSLSAPYEVANGLAVMTPAVTNGLFVANGVPNWWSLINQANQILYAHGPLNVGSPAAAGIGFTMQPFSIVIPAR